MRRDHCDMPGNRHHSVFLVDRALPDTTPRMRVDVSEHLELALGTQVPELREALAVEDHDALIERVWIQIVVADVSDNASVAAVTRAEKKCAAFAAAAAAAAQIAHEAEPGEARDRDGVLSSQGKPRN